MMKIDLHCHTVLSDGSTRVKELVELAAACDVKVFALTDHDTMAGCPEAVAEGERLGVRVIPGVEISTADTLRGGKAHILCYAPRHPEKITPILEETTANRLEAMRKSVRLVTELYPISEEIIFRRAAESTNIYKQHVMMALMDAGYADEMFGAVFKKLFDSKQGLAYVPVQYPDVYDVLDAIDAAEGIAVLAHPSEYRSMPLLRDLCAKNRLKGIEVRHPRNRAEEMEEMCALCAAHNLAETGGTDFHGFYTTRKNPVGTYTTAPAEYKKLFDF